MSFKRLCSSIIMISTTLESNEIVSAFSVCEEMYTLWCRYRIINETTFLRNRKKKINYTSTKWLSREHSNTETTEKNVIGVGGSLYRKYPPCS